jgi:glycosyltransferase involved in cell wall biosynthesis
MVVGDEQTLTQEPAMPLEDIEFGMRLKLSRGLRREAIEKSARPRGNVAFTPALRRPLRQGLPRVLIVSPYLPFPLSHGGAVRIYNLCRALAPTTDFILACFHEANEPIRYSELHDVFREVYVADIDEKYADTSVPSQIAAYRNSAMRRLIEELCIAGGVDAVQLEYTQMAEYRTCIQHAPVILVEHDITFTLYSQLKDPEAQRWLDFEREALREVDAVWTMSEEDRAVAIQNGSRPESTIVVPNGVDLDRFRPERRSPGLPAVLFVGSFRHLPNLLAFEVLREKIMPEIWRAVPECRLRVIAGPAFERAARTAGRTHLLAKDPRIDIEGFVEDVRPAYRECDVVAIPLPVSAGTNIKVMEAMACGRAIVSTPAGCRGLGLRDGSDLIIRELGPPFIEALTAVLSDSELRRGIGRAARISAEARFGWETIAEPITYEPGALNSARQPPPSAYA